MSRFCCLRARQPEPTRGSSQSPMKTNCWARPFPLLLKDYLKPCLKVKTSNLPQSHTRTQHVLPSCPEDSPSFLALQTVYLTCMFVLLFICLLMHSSHVQRYITAIFSVAANSYELVQSHIYDFVRFWSIYLSFLWQLWQIGLPQLSCSHNNFSNYGILAETIVTSLEFY